MSDQPTDDGPEVTITAEGAKVMASEKVSTGDYENAQVSTTLEVTIEGADVTDGMSSDVRRKLYGLAREVQSQTESAAEERRPTDDDQPKHEVR